MKKPLLTDVSTWMERFERIVVYRVKACNKSGPPRNGNTWRCIAFDKDGGAPKANGSGANPREAVKSAIGRMAKCPKCGTMVECGKEN